MNIPVCISSEYVIIGKTLLFFHLEGCPSDKARGELPMALWISHIAIIPIKVGIGNQNRIDLLRHLL